MPATLIGRKRQKKKKKTKIRKIWPLGLLPTGLYKRSPKHPAYCILSRTVAYTAGRKGKKESPSAGFKMNDITGLLLNTVGKIDGVERPCFPRVVKIKGICSRRVQSSIYTAL